MQNPDTGYSGIFMRQNTMGVGGEKGKIKTEENYIKNGEKGLKNASFWVINSKYFRGEGKRVFRPPSRCRCRKLIRRGKNEKGK